MSFTTDDIVSLLENRISENRFSHSMGVAHCAKELAKTFNYDESKAYLAGILHDCATQYSGEEMIGLAEKIGFELEPEEYKNPVSSLHAILGSYVAKHEYGIDDEEILQAISYHSSGGINMTTLDKIISLADAIEPSRQGKEIDEIRILAKNNLDDAILQKCSLYIVNTIQSRQHLNIQKIEAYNFLLKELDAN
jgi:predicted HD superfamily hydrolase involved in NAD metabolism